MLEYLQSLLQLSEEELLKLYSKQICIAFNGRYYVVDFDAVSYNALITLIETCNKENN